MAGGVNRCPWCGDDPVYVAYHDQEWAVPVYDDRLLFEMLILEGAQAGLSWLTILKKRPAYRRAFHEFDAAIMARYNASSIRRLMADPGIVRNRLKIEAAIGNARACLRIHEQYDSFAEFIWQFVDGRPLLNRRRSMRNIPARTRQSDHMSRELKQRGFRFTGSTICYAYMQSVGMVNDHLVRCFRHEQVRRMSD